ncbi:hypothetical protein GCM10011354_02690 [Egicoccus halophilus]|uniref:Ribosomal RNA small subunit methyltransferase G n=2 Tax=Egicoccus halophilus TaxID=1670830 RepID=A0A8J3AC21_9ACTN|nr:hypothetical protein GCM10011354_02690 [Egicoccus halophilus]
MPDLSDRQRSQLETFVTAVEQSPHNLVSRQAKADLRTRHLSESLRFAHGLPAGPRLLDVGSGGGFPGIVIAVVRPDLRVELLEATGKKATFLRNTAKNLGLPVIVHHGRAEDLARSELRGRFDLVTARAVAALDRLLPWTMPFLRPGGELHAIKGARWREELEASDRALGSLGAVVVETPDASHDVREDGPFVVRIVRSST